MKSESEIRRHMQDLIILSESPCRCRGTKHELGCIIGGYQMQAAALALAWALGEAEHYQEEVDRLRGGASDYVTSG